MLLINGMHTGYTIISSVFIDRYLPGANGEFVKVYLTLVRLMEDQRQEVTVAALADRLEHTETDVVRALTYWERQGLLTLYQENDRRQLWLRSRFLLLRSRRSRLFLRSSST